MLRSALSLFAAVLLLVSGATRAQEAAGAATKSWINIASAYADKKYVEGDPWDVTVEYFLDEADAKGDVSLQLLALGPWVDCPDGKYETKRHHVTYHGGVVSGMTKIKPGEGKHTFNFKIPNALPRNGLLLLAQFQVNGKALPWHVRAGGPWFTRKSGFFELGSDKPGNLFLYGEPVKMTATLKNVKEPGVEKTFSVKVYDVSKAVVEEKEIKFTPEKDGQVVALDLKVEKRGTFLIEAEVKGWEKVATTFCRIPDVQAVTKGARTQFGLHATLGGGDPERTEEMCAIAQKLGMTFSRNFIGWCNLEPARGKFRLETLDKSLDISRKYGIDPVICIVYPPVWALTGAARNIHYQAFDADWDAWRNFVHKATEHYKGRLYAWEWLNEIVPGDAKSPVDSYMNIVKIGTETARAIDPNLKFHLAGGLFPRSFRKQLLQAGIGNYVDSLPVHYSNGPAILEAREDLDAGGNKNVTVWDNETARGVNAWNTPPIEDLANTVQSDWVLNCWTSELAAGVERICYFGGGGDPAGGWSYLLDDYSPRPATAAIAVLVSKMHGGKPLGSFAEGKASFYLFERDGKAMLYGVCTTPGEKVSLSVGAPALTSTDYQGNETELATKAGVAEIEFGKLGMFIEKGDLDVLKAYVVATVQTSRARGGKGAGSVDALRVTMLKGESSELFVALKNPYDKALSGKIALQIPEGWPALEALAFSLQPREEKIVSIKILVPADAAVKDHAMPVKFTFDWDKLPAISEPLTVSVISPEMLGNMLQNGDFETEPAKPGSPAVWSGKAELIPSEGLGLGLGKNVIRFAKADNWLSMGQNIDVNGGDSYLYTAWVWNQGINACSNLYQTFPDGKTVPLYSMQVFNAGENNAYWQVFTCRYKAPPGIKTLGIAPTAKGGGTAYYDNIRVTLFEGTDHVAECHRAPAAPKIDGKLDEWTLKCPIPLIGKNQLAQFDKSYAWTPENLNAVGYAMWDDANLYVAIDAKDDVHHPAGGDAGVIQGDSLVLGIDPTNRSPEGAAKAFSLYFSQQEPGMTGRMTIFRPAEKSGGQRSGQLARDSSVYEMSIAKEKGRTLYEIKIPFSEMGGFQPGLGRKFALSMQLNDNDGKGLGAAMLWGGGLHPEWRPGDFGVITLTK